LIRGEDIRRIAHEVQVSLFDAVGAEDHRMRVEAVG
jgi:hypothetical protein